MIYEENARADIPRSRKGAVLALGQDKQGWGYQPNDRSTRCGEHRI